MDAAKIAQHIVDEGDAYALSIAVNEQACGVSVTSINLYVNADEEEGYGDLCVYWEIEGLQNTGGGDMGALLMRGADDEVGAVMQRFYSEQQFDERLAQILVAAGFSEDAANAVCGSEWGMQDEGRASYDANEIAEEVRAAMQQVAA